MADLSDFKRGQIVGARMGDAKKNNPTEVLNAWLINTYKHI